MTLNSSTFTSRTKHADVNMLLNCGQSKRAPRHYDQNLGSQR
jgi:hypothetical protein